MKVLVTGHDGYLGAVVVPALQAAGHEVVGLDTGLFTRCTLGPEPPRVPAFTIDVREVTADHCAGVDAVVHLAALSNDPLGNLDPELTAEVNYRATVRLAAAAKQAGVARFLFSSSCSLYGAGAGGQALTESAPLAPVTAYGRSKVLAEQGLRALADRAFSPVFLRNATAYGFSPRLRTDLVLNDLTAHAVLTGAVRLRSDGSARRPLVHVDDIAAAFIAVLESPRETVHAKAYNIGSTGENHRIRDVADLVAQVVRGSRVTYADRPDADRRNYAVCCDRITVDVPSFRPRWTLRAGIVQLADAYRRHGLGLDDLAAERYHRLSHLGRLRAAGLLDPDLRWSRTARA